MPKTEVIRLPARERRAAAPSDASDVQADALAAILAGQIAGLAMIGALALAYAFFSASHASHHPSHPLQIVAAVFIGDEALQEPPATGHLFSGALAHQLGPSLFWSLVFAVLATRFQ